MSDKNPSNLHQRLMQKCDKDKKQHFESWLRDPMVQVIMSTIPSSSIPEGLRMLLESAFYAGWGGGQAALLVALMEEHKRR